VISKEQILDFHSTHYNGSNIIVVGAGDINHDQLCELTQKYFGNLSDKPAKAYKNSD